MALWYRNLRRISNLLPLGFFSGLHCQECGQTTKLLSSSLFPFPIALEKIDATRSLTGLCASRFSTAAKIPKEVSHEIDLISFIRSAFDDVEGPFHCWLNRSEEIKEFSQKDGVFIIVAEVFLKESSGSWGDQMAILRKVKFLQQRYPWLHIVGFQSGSSDCSMANHNHLIKFIMEEYISFPILLCSKTFTEVEKGPCCFLFKRLNDPPIYHERDIDLTTLFEVIRDLNEQRDKKAGVTDKLKSTWSKSIEGSKEPFGCSCLRDLLLYFPACISADEAGNRLFLSDSNRHRVIVFDSNGKILDMIGSFPGFEDGDFETAKLMRPAASYYHASEDCLYLVDSENHAIRRADMGKRVLETLYPTGNGKGQSGLWSWVLDKLGLKRDVSLRSVEFDSELLLFPWHILESEENNLLIMNKSLDTLWVMDMGSGMIHNVLGGHTNVMEFSGARVMKKLSCLGDVPCRFLHQPVDSNSPSNRIPNAGLVSSFVTLQDHLIICNTVGQRVLMLKKQAEVASSIEFSNFGILGLPYWLSSSLERVYPTGGVIEESHVDHVQSFTLFPGRIDIHLVIDIPGNTGLVEPLQESCVWCQARGAAMVFLEAEGATTSPEKVGVAQQWYDELDNCAFVTEPEPDVATKDKSTKHRNLEDGKVHIDCVVNTSPGTSEVIISAPLYLRLQKDCEDAPEEKAAQIANILKDGNAATSETRDRFICLLLNLDRDLGDLVFMKPLHVKIKFNTPSHPKAENSRDIILSDSAVDINVSLD